MVDLDKMVKGLLADNPDATLWDLLREWYNELHGSFPVNETPEQVMDVVRLHLSGLTPKTVSKVLNINEVHVVAYLDGMGFIPWTQRSQGLPTTDIYSDMMEDIPIEEICEKYNISKHLALRVFGEFVTVYKLAGMGGGQNAN